MRLSTLYRRNLRHHWRAHAAVALGTAAATAALTGALLVGDALRGSLRDTALRRLGRITHAVQTPRFFRAALAGDLEAAPGFGNRFAGALPIIIARGSATHAEHGTHVHDITIHALEDPGLEPGARRPATAAAALGRAVRLNRALADELRARPGDDVLLRLERPDAVSPETLLGRRDDRVLTLRLTVAEVIGTPYGDVALRPRHAPPRNAFVPLATLQRALAQPERVNAMLLATRHGRDYGPPGSAADSRWLEAALAGCATLADYGLRLRASPAHGYVALESAALLLPLAAEEAGRAAAASLGWPAAGVLTYLANALAPAERPGRAIPYSTVSAVEAVPALWRGLRAPGGGAAPELAPGELLLNEWAARDLGAAPGDAIALSYYTVGPFARLETCSATLRLAGAVALAGAAADRGLAPEYPGVTDAANLADWDPPFPLDLNLIREQDEAYWDAHGATPKALLRLADGQRLWAPEPERFGRLTALCMYPPPELAPAGAQAALEAALRARLRPAAFGLRVEDLRGRALAASRGTTDFGALFLGFSSFLIVAAGLLIALLLRLGVERRAAEIGLLLATGFPRRRILGLLLAEAAVAAGLGAGLGLLAAGGYAWLMLAGLRSWWSAAVRAPVLELHSAPLSYVAGLAGALVVALAAVGGGLRGVTRHPPRALLSGRLAAGGDGAPGRSATDRRARRGLVVAAALAGAGLALTGLPRIAPVPPTAAFFGGGAALLVAGLAALHHWLRSAPRRAGGRARPGGPRRAGGLPRLGGLLGLGARNARRHPGRSLLTAGLIAAATFSITALQALRRTPPADPAARGSGTGGFALLAETTVALPHDLNAPAGRRALNLPEADEAALAGASFVPLRLRSGDEASCLSLYVPAEPRVLGAPPALVERGGFRFAAHEARTVEDRRNPWRLLGRPLAGGAIPAVADEAAARWQLHREVGDELVIRDERGHPARLRLVALLQGSILQGEVIVGEADFTRLFPSISGYGCFLIDVPAGSAGVVEQVLERGLADFGLAATPTADRLAGLLAVQNTYLSTFQTLGGLGLLLGTLGLTAVMLRNVWERRAELALLRTLGFSRAALGTIVLVENALLAAGGLLAGLLAAAVAVLPHVIERAAPVPWGTLLPMFGAILAAGLLAGAAALATTLRAPLLPALRTE